MVDVNQFFLGRRGSNSANSFLRQMKEAGYGTEYLVEINDEMYFNTSGTSYQCDYSQSHSGGERCWKLYEKNSEQPLAVIEIDTGALTGMHTETISWMGTDTLSWNARKLIPNSPKEEKQLDLNEKKQESYNAPTPVSNLSTVFPYEIEARDWNRVISDHCAKSYSISTQASHFLKLTTFNLMMAGPRCFSIKENQHPYQERLEEFNHRLSNIIKTLKKEVAVRNTAVFLLQEVDSSKIAELEEGMGPQWKAIEGTSGLVTLYNTAELDLEAIPTAHITTIDTRNDFYLKTVFKDKTDITVNVVNVHRSHRENTPDALYKTQCYIRSLCDANYPTIIAGDFNQRLPSPSLLPIAETTGIVPSNLRGEHQSNYDCTYACFLFKEGDLKQLTTREIISGYMNETDNAHYSLIPLNHQEIKGLQRLGILMRPPVPVLFADNYKLFSMGPTLGELKKFFPTEEQGCNITFTEDSTYHIFRKVIVKNGDNTILYDWNCTDINSQIEILDRIASDQNLSLIKTIDNPLRNLFQFINNSQNKCCDTIKVNIKRKALELIALHNDLVTVITYHPNADVELMIRTFQNKVEQSLKSYVYDKEASWGTVIGYAWEELVSYLICSLIGALIGAVIGAVIGAAISIIAGSFTLPILGPALGLLSAAIMVSIIGNGVGWIAGSCYYAYKRDSYAHKLAFFNKATDSPGLALELNNFINGVNALNESQLSTPPTIGN